MNIHTRQVSKYLDVQVEIENSTHDLGFQSKLEVQRLVEMLKSACEDMEDHLKDIERNYPDSTEI